MRAGVLDVRIDAAAIQAGLTHLVFYVANPDGPTLCGLDSAGMHDVEAEVDCPLCVAADEAMETGL